MASETKRSHTVAEPVSAESIVKLASVEFIGVINMCFRPQQLWRARIKARREAKTTEAISPKSPTEYTFEKVLIETKKAFLKRIFGEDLTMEFGRKPTILMSKYFGTGIMATNILTHITAHKYVLCVGYSDENDPSIHMDTQIGITGNCNKGETPENAARRECAEETGIWPNTMEFIGEPSDSKTHFYVVNARNTRPCIKEDELLVSKAGRDPLKRRVCIFVIGSKDDIRLIMDTSTYRLVSRDKIPFIVGLSGCDVQDFIKKFAK